jgi:hypothetical protein
MTNQSLFLSTAFDEEGQAVSLPQLLKDRLNVLHFQDSFGSGRTCSCVLASIEANLSQLSQYAVTILVVADDAFDKDNPPATQVQRVMMSKAEMKRLSLLDEEGYVRRTTLIANAQGNVLATLPVETEEELSTHIEQRVLPALAAIQNNSTV